MWPFSKKKKSTPITRKSVQTWVDQQLEAGVPHQYIYDDLFHRPDGMAFEVYKIRYNVSDDIFGLMVDRNTKGRELEKAGLVNQAIALYEANVDDRHMAPFSYKRLRIIYTKQKRYADALRVCQIYLSEMDNHKNIKQSKRDEWENHRRKLMEKVGQT